MLSRAFQEDPTFTEIISEETERIENLIHLFKFVIKYGLKYGLVIMTSGMEGISVWLPPEKTVITTWKAIKSGAFSLVLKIKSKTLNLQRKIDNYMEDMHKRLVPDPHWFLPVIGVEPEYQGLGHGKNMLSFMINHIEEERLPIYLETNSTKNVQFYNKFDFFVLHKEKIPYIGLKQWFMLRNPK